MTITPALSVRCARLVVAGLTLAALARSPARAEFLHDVRRTFQTDIPHFFQDDVPGTFGGQPTSHTRSSCKPSASSANPQPGKPTARTAAPLATTNAVPPEKPNGLREAPGSGQ